MLKELAGFIATLDGRRLDVDTLGLAADQVQLSDESLCSRLHRRLPVVFVQIYCFREELAESLRQIIITTKEAASLNVPAHNLDLCQRVHRKGKEKGNGVLCTTSS